MKIPQDIANLLTLAIRDVIWFRGKILSFLTECGVPEAVLLEVKERQDKNEPTVKIIPDVLARLSTYGDDGNLPQQQILTKMYYWKDVHSIPPDMKEKAIA
jgi:hypothetical protein